MISMDIYYGSTCPCVWILANYRKDSAGNRDSGMRIVSRKTAAKINRL